MTRTSPWFEDADIRCMPHDLNDPLRGRNLPYDPAEPASSDPFRLSGSVGRYGENRRDDLIKAQILLANAGYYTMPRPGAPTGWPSGEIERSIIRLQKDKGLETDGTMLPFAEDGGIGVRGEGETLAALQADLGEVLAGYEAPTPEEVDAHYDERATRIARGEEEPDSGIVTAGEDGTAEHPIGVKRPAEGGGPRPNLGLFVRLPKEEPPQSGETASDIDDTSGPQWRDGQRVAQMAPPMPARAAGVPLPHDPNAERDQYGVSKAEKQVGRMLEQGFGKAKDLLLQGSKWQPWSPRTREPDKRDDMDYVPAGPLPPLQGKPADPMPLPPQEGGPNEPENNGPLKGRPNDPAQPDIERLIPPEMKDWYETLDPFDQELGKELMLVFNNSGGRRGIRPTREGNAYVVKEIMEYYKSQRPEIAGNFEHVGGAWENGKEGAPEVPEEYIKGRDSQGPKGATWPDVTIKYANQLAKDTAEEYLRLFTGKVLKDGVTFEKPERDQVARARYNKPGEMMEHVPKLLADQKDGTVSQEQREAYRALVRKYAQDIGARFEALLKDKSKL